MNLETHTAYFNAGVNYGFPSCCIISFIEDLINKSFYFREERKLHGTGFIPCIKCNETYSEKELIDIINSNRLKEYSFPSRQGFIRTENGYERIKDTIS